MIIKKHKNFRRKTDGSVYVIVSVAYNQYQDEFCIVYENVRCVKQRLLYCSEEDFIEHFEELI